MDHEAQSILVARHPCREIHSVVLCPQGRGVHEPLTEMCCNLKRMHMIQNKPNWWENVKYSCTCTCISYLLNYVEAYEVISGADPGYWDWGG